MTATTPAIGTFDSGSELCRLFDYFCATYWAHKNNMVVEAPESCEAILGKGILSTVYAAPILHSYDRVLTRNLCSKSKQIIKGSTCIQVRVNFPNER